MLLGFPIGGAGNVVNNLRALGARVSFVGTVGDDPEGQRVRELCSAIDVDPDGLIEVLDRPTTRKTRIVAHNQQVVRADCTVWYWLLTLVASRNCSQLKKKNVLSWPL